MVSNVMHTTVLPRQVGRETVRDAKLDSEGYVFLYVSLITRNLPGSPYGHQPSEDP